MVEIICLIVGDFTFDQYDTFEFNYNEYKEILVECEDYKFAFINVPSLNLSMLVA